MSSAALCLESLLLFPQLCVHKSNVHFDVTVLSLHYVSVVLLHESCISKMLYELVYQTL